VFDACNEETETSLTRLGGVGRGSLGSSFNNDMMLDVFRTVSCLIAAAGAGSGDGAEYGSWAAEGALIGGRGIPGEGLDFISRLPPALSPRRLRTAW
jgi:hypothetical protein